MFFFNVREIRDLSKRKALFLFCMSQKREIYFFQETHSSFKDETFWRNQWGGNILFCHGTNHSAGVLILFDRNFSGSILQSFSSSEGRWIIVVILLGDFLFILANVYGFNNHTQNSSFFMIFFLKSLI